MTEIVVGILVIVFAFLFLDWPHRRARGFPWRQYPDSLQAKIHDAIIRLFNRLRR